LEKSIYDENFTEDFNVIQSELKALKGEEGQGAMVKYAALQEKRVHLLAQELGVLRPELDQFYVCETPIHELDMKVREQFQRIIYHVDPFQLLHQSILNGIRDRYSTPFFHALQAYSRKPHGVFHALPLSQGRSLQNSHWIRDMLEFYGDNTFLGETSSTQGGMDSLLDPKGAIKQAHHKIAETFGSMESYLVTNGTSTSNKIVMQTTLRPGDIVIISADCHKSIPYSVMLTGALPIFLETYPLRQHDLYGAVTLERIKEVMLDLREKGRLHRLRHITLTNSTFDGLIYNTERFMLDILALKEDIIFHWDEAWYAFSHFNPIYSGRTAMTVTSKLEKRFKSDSYRRFYKNWKERFEADRDQTEKPDHAQHWIRRDLYPDPDKVCLRVYATQSTHKTLTSFRQGSMIHIHDQSFDRDLFLEAYRLHTSTSPNYQILASLDVGRRQVSLEGYERVKNTLFLAQTLRHKISENESLKPYFRVLNDEDLVPEKMRSTEKADPKLYRYADIRRSWGNAAFVVDPTRVTVDVSRTGMDGSSFRQLLMNRYDIQVNKTSRQTVLFIVNIGSTEATIAYLLDVLTNIAEQLQQANLLSPIERVPEVEVDLPQRRYFSPAFKPFECSSCDIGDMRLAFYTGAREENVEYVPLSDETIKEVLNDRKLVSATFVTPYPPGFPVLTPGQLITYDILLYLQKIKIKEIHGYDADVGLKIFKQGILDQLQKEGSVLNQDGEAGAEGRGHVGCRES
jgi:arginine decarboxylase